MADQIGKDFYLVNLVKESSKEKIENTFRPSRFMSQKITQELDR